MRISVVIPTLNEASSLPALLTRLGNLEILVADGGSTDGTADLARQHGARVVVSEASRGLQLHSGARAATGEVLWFLHADSLPPPHAPDAILKTLQETNAAGGHFRLIFHGTDAGSRFLTWLYPHLRKLGLLYGDSGFFVRREVYEASGGFKPLPLFEDLEFARRLRTFGGLRRIECSLVTSSRRWQRRGFARTFARWVWLQVLFWMGAKPEWLAARYTHIRDDGHAARSAMRSTTRSKIPEEGGGV